MPITAYSPTTGGSGPVAASAPADAAPAAAQPRANPAASSVVKLSAQGVALAVSTSKEAALPLPDLDAIAQIDQALAGVPDQGPVERRAQAQLNREKDKLGKKFSMLDVDALRLVRDKMRAQLQQRAAPTEEQQKADEAAYQQRLKDSQPLG